MKKHSKASFVSNASSAVTTVILNGSKSLIDRVAEKSREVAEFFHLSPNLKDHVTNMADSFPHLPNQIEDMILYYIKTLEYFELYSLDQFDPRLDRVEQKLEFLAQKLQLHYEVSKNVKLKARQLLALNY